MVVHKEITEGQAFVEVMDSVEGCLISMTPYNKYCLSSQIDFYQIETVRYGILADSMWDNRDGILRLEDTLPKSIFKTMKRCHADMTKFIRYHNMSKHNKVGDYPSVKDAIKLGRVFVTQTHTRTDEPNGYRFNYIKDVYDEGMFEFAMIDMVMEINGFGQKIRSNLSISNIMKPVYFSYANHWKDLIVMDGFPSHIDATIKEILGLRDKRIVRQLIDEWDN